MALHLARCAGDHLLLVHEGQRDLLVARHAGRGALVSRSADRFSCGRARQLATGLGLQRYDWILVSDPVASLEPECWQEMGHTVISAIGEAGSERAAATGGKGALTMEPKALKANPWATQFSATSPSLQVGQQLQSPGLSVRPLAPDSQAAVLQAGRLRWLLLPDRQSWRSWQGQPQGTGGPITGLWLGFGLRQSDRPQLPKLRPDHLWITASSTPGWRAL
jgi:competence protein ComEC